MRKISSLPNSEAESTNYPFGRIKDQTSDAQGTPVIEATYSDHIQSLYRFFTETGISPNNLPDNTENGFQLFSAIEKFFEPVGTIRDQAGLTYDDRWLLADGSLIDVAEYPDLFNEIGYTYGGVGSVFKLPDLKTRFRLGSGTGSIIGHTGGEATHTLTIDEIPSHTHTDRHLSSTSGSNVGYTGNTGSLDNAQSTGSSGNGQAHNNMPPYVVIVTLIKVKYK